MLLAFTPYGDEEKLDSGALLELFDQALDMFELDVGQLCVAVGDNASINVAFAARAGIPLIGCFSHRLNLAVC
ncbi:TPA: hypothetical protein N0F65_001745 [Lagenidium giganteum]|uniref:Uncharacterized protein n=1 Tax=Lagenidium giganteum TaxID=4803 RepID=A0AAV2Z369_9STRA|nr:TPA: hypothetical protein N0F65_001745 [Lagenidium giganteum]